MEFSDIYLLQKFLQGEVACFNVLIQRWQKRIFNFIYRNVSDYEEARDLTQETFAKAFIKARDLQDPSRFIPWLYKVALNECRMSLRRSRGRQKVPIEIYDSPESNEVEIAAVLVRQEESAQQRLEREETVARLREVLALLPEEQRLVIVMKEYEDLKFHEIAEILDVPLSTVKSRLYMGLKTLRRLLLQRELSRS